MKAVYQLNSNEQVVNQIRSALLENDGYCPCKIEHNADTKCMCKEFRESQEAGICHCGLYQKTFTS